MTIYNELDSFAADWLERLAEAGHISPGRVDRRSIKELTGAELKGFNRVHLFAGIAGWDLALQLAGWPADRPVWTGSCPCQPFSAAGKRKGQSDDRHLWPDMFRLVRECRPDTIFGEQVASAIGHGWLDGVFADLESEGYACGAIVLGAHSVGAPHIRQRLWWVAESEGQRAGTIAGGSCEGVCVADGGGTARGLAEPESATGQPDDGAVHGVQEQVRQGGPDRLAGDGTRGPCGPDSWVSPNQSGPQGRNGSVVRERADERSPWSASTWHPCRDGKARRIPIEPALFPLAHGLPGRVGLLRGAGNAIVPAVAAEFTRSFMEAQ